VLILIISDGKLSVTKPTLTTSTRTNLTNQKPINQHSMNRNQRKRLEKAITALENAKEAIFEIKEEEQEKFDNLNEGLQATEANQKIEQNTYDLESAGDDLESIIQELNELLEN
jgi:biopolymer transport protein ExbB/TolQ